MTVEDARKALHAASYRHAHSRPENKEENARVLDAAALEYAIAMVGSDFAELERFTEALPAAEHDAVKRICEEARRPFYDPDEPPPFDRDDVEERKARWRHV